MLFFFFPFFFLISFKDTGTPDAQSLVPSKSVKFIKEQVKEMSLGDKDPDTLKTRGKNGSDTVDAGVRLDREQVNVRLLTKVTSIPLKVYSDVCLKLNIKRSLQFDDFRMLAERVGLSRDQTEFIEQNYSNHTDEILKTWSRKKESTAGKLIEILKEKDFDRTDVADILENWVYEV